jgi:hypothetical protein
MMTTVAFRDGVLAVDSGVGMEARGCFLGNVRKCYTGDGVIGAAAGDAAEMREFRKWIEAGAEPGKWINGQQNIQGIIVRKGGAVSIYCNGAELDASGEFFAAGSGCAVALGAMAAGASAVQAVEIACIYDMSTRGPVVALPSPQQQEMK